MIPVPLIAFGLKNWKLIAGGIGLAILGAMLAVAMADARHWKKRYAAEAEIVDDSLDAAGAANGWPQGKRLARNQLAAQIAQYGYFIRDVRASAAEAAARDARAAAGFADRSMANNAEVSANVQNQLDRVSSELDASRALAAQRLRDLERERAAGLHGGAGGADLSQAPDASCRAYFAATCDEVLALLAEAERNTAQLLGWQAWYPQVLRDYEAATAE